MIEKKFPKFDPNKWLNPKLARINLQLAALYLTAYELMKFSIIDSVALAFVDQEPVSEEAAAKWKEVLGDEGVELVKINNQRYEQQLNDYRAIVGLNYDDRERFGLRPSAEYLRECKALDESDLADLELLREHRNRLAHELPKFIFGQGHDVKLEYLIRIKEIIHKVRMYWARIYGEIPDDVPDNQVYTGPVIAIDVLIDAVMEYLDQISSDP